MWTHSHTKKNYIQCNRKPEPNHTKKFRQLEFRPEPQILKPEDKIEKITNIYIHLWKNSL